MTLLSGTFHYKYENKKWIGTSQVSKDTSPSYRTEANGAHWLNRGNSTNIKVSSVFSTIMNCGVRSFCKLKARGSSRLTLKRSMHTENVKDDIRLELGMIDGRIRDIHSEAVMSIKNKV